MPAVGNTGGNACATDAGARPASRAYGETGISIQHHRPGVTIPRDPKRRDGFIMILSGRKRVVRTGFALPDLVAGLLAVSFCVPLAMHSMGRSREQANRAKCANNLRQI